MMYICNVFQTSEISTILSLHVTAFQIPGLNFNAQAKIFIVKKVYNRSLSKLKIRTLLEHREDFLILKLQILSLQGLNISFNCRQDTAGSTW